MKIMGFTASPRKQGNTAWVVNKMLEGAKDQGAETQSWYFSIRTGEDVLDLCNMALKHYPAMLDV
jgi:multimeric flavodoxin WrbA